METQDVLGMVGAERIRQDTKWGRQDHPPFAWITILAEEVGEAAKALLEGKRKRYVEEMIQVAAVAVAAVESQGRGNEVEWEPITELQRKLKEAQKEIEVLRAGANVHADLDLLMNSDLNVLKKEILSRIADRDSSFERDPFLDLLRLVYRARGGRWSKKGLPR